MMNNKRTLTLATVALTAVACGGESPNSNNSTSQRPIQCRSGEYVPFDAANQTNQVLRVQAYVDMVALMTTAEAAAPFEPSLAATNFAEAKRLYEETASLRSKVQERTDDHYDDRPVVGVEIDAAIMDAFAKGASATTSLEAKVARQTVDKQLIHFFYLSVFHEMVLGERSKWDEAFAYAGMASDNAEATRKALAAVATNRDATNNTTLASSIYVGLIDGACALTEALQTQGVESLDYKTVPALLAAVQQVDLDMQRVLAFSAGHEAIEMGELQAQLSSAATPELREEMWVKLSELDPYFVPIERIMMREGGDSMQRASTIRQMIDAAWASPTDDWMSTFDAQAVVQALELQYGIDIKG